MLPRTLVFPHRWARMAAMPVMLLLVPPAWLLGTFPSAQLVARMHGRDILREGSGNPGASNVARLMGWRAGLAVLIIDIAKGAIAAGVGLWIGGRPGGFVLAMAAVLGHTFPIYRKGGKGVATAGGALLVLYPFIAAGVGIVWFVVRPRTEESVARIIVVRDVVRRSRSR